jgi:NTP pyrophosphatase (non-canonical NTP hydrolase)
LLTETTTPPATFAEYQRDAARTINPYLAERDVLIMGALGLGGETGEVLEPIKKHLFHNKPLDVAALSKELGDVLWYVAALCSALNLDMGTIASENIAKLRDRFANDTRYAWLRDQIGEPAPAVG